MRRMAADANRRVRVTAKLRRNEWWVERPTIQFDSEMAAPDRSRTDPNWHAEFTPIRVRMGGGGLLCLPLVGKGEISMNGKKKSVYRLTRGAFSWKPVAWQHRWASLRFS